MALESVFKISVLLNMIDNMTSPMSKAASAIDGDINAIKDTTEVVSPVVKDVTDRAVVNLDKLSNAFGGIQKAGAVMTGAGAALVGVGAKMVSATFDTQNALGELSSLGVQDLKAVENAAKDFSDTWAGTTKSDFITASYDIKSGIASLTDEGVAQFTELAALTGKATKSTTEEMGSLFATGYGIYKGFYDDMSDLDFGEMFSAGISTAVKNYKTSGSQMAASISMLGATATNNNVPLEEQLAILGQLQTTMSGSEAATKYKAFLNQAAKAGGELGLTFVDANNQLLSTPDILDALRNKYGDTIDAVEKQELKKAFGTDEAVAMIDLLYQNVGSLRSGVDDLAGSMRQGTSVTREMAQAIQDTPEQKFQAIKQQIHNNVEELAGNLLPTVNETFDKVNDFIKQGSDWIANNQDTVQSITQVVMALTAFLLIGGGLLTTVGTLGKAIISIHNAFGLIKGAVNGLKAAFSVAKAAMGGLNAAFLASPITWVIAGVAALVAIFIVLWNRSEAFRSFWLSLFDQVRSAVLGAWQTIKPSLEQLGDALMSLWEAVQPIIQIIEQVGAVVLVVLAGVFMGALQGAIAAIQPLINALTNVVEFITNVVNAAIALFSGDFSGALEYAGAAVDNFKDFFINGFDAILSFLGGFADGFLKVIDMALSAVGIDTSGIIEDIKNTVSTGMDAVSGVFADVMTAAGDTVKEKLGDIQNAYEQHGGGIEGIAAAAMEGIKGLYTSGFTFIDNLTGGKLSELRNRFTDRFEDIRGTIQDKIGGARDAISTGMEAAKTAAGNQLNDMRNAYEQHGGGIEGIVAAAMTGARNTISSEFDAIDNLTGGKLSELRNRFTDRFEDIRGTIQDKISGARDAISTGMEAAKTAAGNQLNDMRNAYEQHGGGIEGIVAAAMTGARNTYSTGYNLINSLTDGRLENVRKIIQGKLEAARATATSIFEQIRTGIKDKLDAAAAAVQGAIEKIKGFFKFDWELPKLKMPTIDVEGKWSMNPPSVPKFSVKWNAEGAILNSPQIFGKAGDTYLGGGEAGQEAVLPLTTLWTNMRAIIQNIFDNNSDDKPEDNPRATGQVISSFIMQKTSTFRKETVETREKETVNNTSESKGGTTVYNYNSFNIYPRMSEIKDLSLLQEMADELKDSANNSDVEPELAPA